MNDVRLLVSSSQIASRRRDLCRAMSMCTLMAYEQHCMALPKWKFIFCHNRRLIPLRIILFDDFLKVFKTVGVTLQCVSCCRLKVRGWFAIQQKLVNFWAPSFRRIHGAAMCFRLAVLTLLAANPAANPASGPPGGESVTYFGWMNDSIMFEGWKLPELFWFLLHVLFFTRFFSLLWLWCLTLPKTPLTLWHGRFDEVHQASRTDGQQLSNV